MHKINVYTCLFVLVLFFSCSNDEEFNSVFNTYKFAIIDKNGVSAAECVDSATYDYFVSIKKSVLYDDSALVSKKPLLDQLYIISLRKKLHVDSIKKCSPKDFFAMAVNSGQIGNSLIEKIYFDKLKVIEKNRAYCSIKIDKLESEFDIAFSREANNWKIDITSLIISIEHEIILLLDAQEIHPRTFIENSASKISKPWIVENHWYPLD